MPLMQDRCNKKLFKRAQSIPSTPEETPIQANTKKSLVDKVRRKLLSGELSLKDIIEQQDLMAEFRISLPPNLPVDDDSEDENMTVCRQDVTVKRSEDSEIRTMVPDSDKPPAADPSGSAHRK